MLNKLKSINETIKQLIPEFEAYIKDTSIPLVERWAAFVEAPEAFKNNEYYLCDFASLPDEFIGYDGPIHMELHQTMTTQDLIERLEEGIDNAEEGDTYYEAFVGLSIIAVKEEILASNLNSFTYDW